MNHRSQRPDVAASLGNLPISHDRRRMRYSNIGPAVARPSSVSYPRPRAGRITRLKTAQVSGTGNGWPRGLAGFLAVFERFVTESAMFANHSARLACSILRRCGDRAGWAGWPVSGTLPSGDLELFRFLL